MTTRKTRQPKRAQARRDPSARPAARAKPAAPQSTRTKKPTMSSVAFGLIAAGQTNEEVTAALKAQFGLPEKHKHYAGWFRAAAVRRGLVSRTEAKKHAHAAKPASGGAA